MNNIIACASRRERDIVRLDECSIAHLTCVQDVVMARVLNSEFSLRGLFSLLPDNPGPFQGAPCCHTVMLDVDSADNVLNQISIRM